MSTGQDRGSGRYEIRVKGHLGSRWAAWFDGMTLTSESDGTTSIQTTAIIILTAMKRVTLQSSRRCQN